MIKKFALVCSPKQTSLSSNQYWKSKARENIFKCLLDELNVTGSILKIIEGYLKYKKVYEDKFEKKRESNFDEYRNVVLEQKKT